MTIDSYKRSLIVFSDEELDTIDRMNDILEGLRAELNYQDVNTFEVNGSSFSKDTLNEFLVLCYDLSSDSVTIEDGDEGER